MAIEIIRELLARLQVETGCHHTVVLIPHDKSYPVITGTSDLRPPNDVEEATMEPLAIDDAIQYAYRRRL